MSRVLVLFLFSFSFNLYSQGLSFDSSEELAMLPELPTSYGFAGDLPSFASMREFVPPVKLQTGNSCLGWATYYYGLSTMYNIEFGITNTKEKYIHSFDPYFIYSQINSSINDPSCPNTINAWQAITEEQKYGSKKLLFPPYTECDENWNVEKTANILSYTKPYKVNNYYPLDNEDPNFIDTVKNLIVLEMPVIFGLEYYESLQTEVGVNGLWSPNPLEKEDGGHAMCVVGYNDNKFGGAFEIVNSYGENYGDKGYVWIKYDDFKKYYMMGFVMILNENTRSEKKLKQGIREEGYRRYGYIKDEIVNTYEGEYTNHANGLGIFLDGKKDTYYIGNFNNGNKDGFFLIYSKDGWESGTYRDNKFEEITFGFGEDDDELREQELSAMKYFDSFGIELGIRKANSTSSKLGPSINE